MSAWILLRGLSRDNRHWGDFPELFGQIAGQKMESVIAIDLPGNGMRNEERSPSSVSAMVEDCRRTLHAHGLVGPVNLLAMSLGGMVAIDWANRYPEEIDRCVLINTSLRGLSPFYHRLRPRNYGALLGLAFSASAARWENTVFTLTCNIAPPETVDRWIGFNAMRPVSKANAFRQLLAAAKFSSPAARPAARFLLLASQNDRLVNVACSRRIARHWKIPLFEHATAGHDLPLDDGPWVVLQVSHWLQGKRG